ncbi:MAG: TOMM precursor leader peptide-binding protein [Sulfitobacter sp.]
MTNHRDPLLCLAPNADVWCLPGQGAVAHFPTGLVGYPGAVAEACARVLADGPMTAGDLFTTIRGGVDAAVLMSALGHLRSEGLLVAAGNVVLQGPLTGEVLPCSVGVHGVWTPLSLVDRIDYKGAGPWAPVSVCVDKITVGPLFRGRDTDPCRVCIANRTRAHDDLGHLLKASNDALRCQSHQLTEEQARSQVRFIGEALAALQEHPVGTILLRGAEGTSTTAQSLAQGGCGACNAPHEISEVSGKAVLRDGGYRPCDAEEMLARLTGVVDPVTGIVRSLARPDLPNDTHVFVARHAFPLAAPDIQSVMRNRQGRSAGKGQTQAEARIGAIAESLERYAGVARPTDSVCIASIQDLDGAVIRPNDWALFGDAQLDAADDWQSIGQPAAWVPDRVDVDAPLAWAQVQAIGNQEQGWAPADLCWHQFRTQDGCARVGQADSNGCAAGQAASDAQLQGLLELVERDAVGIWWWNKAKRPQLAPDSFDDAWITKTCAKLRALGYHPALFDLTHDLGIPVIAAVAWPVGDRGPMLLGFGAHPSAALAASRALTEIMQALPAQPAQEQGDDPRRGFGLVPGVALDAATVQTDFEFLMPQNTDTERTSTSSVPETAREALDDIVSKLERAGLQVWILDQSRPDVPLPVVRMIVPGLRHFRPRFAPGRLDNVPKMMGWTTGSTRNRLFIKQ